MTNHETLPYRDRVVELTKQGEPPTAEILGYHGTSIRALGRAALLGRFPTTGAFGKEFYFVPITIGRQDGEVVDHPEAREAALTWGALNARVRFMLENSGTEPSEPHLATERARKLWEAMIDPHFCHTGDVQSMHDLSYGQEIIDAVGLPEERVLELYRASQACEGVLLTLATSALREFALHGGDGEGAADNSVMTDNGFPLEHVSRIELVGTYEREVGIYPHTSST